uniref:Uncharacterized protein n=1 Tax=Ditylenchus dipsaci TaxID=166011 RepID=A0A915DR95_9BILA
MLGRVLLDEAQENREYSQADTITQIEGNEIDSKSAYKLIKKAFDDAKQAAAKYGLGGQLQQKMMEVIVALSVF